MEHMTYATTMDRPPVHCDVTGSGMPLGYCDATKALIMPDRL